MLTPPGSDLDGGMLLDRLDGTAPTEAVEAATETLPEMLGARDLTFLIADLSGRAVVRLTTGAAGAGGARTQAGAQAETLPLTGTVYERVLRTQEVDVHALDVGARLVVPVTDRGDAIGLLEPVLPAYPPPRSVADVVAAAHALAHVVIAARRYTDVFDWGQRTTSLSLPAEIQRRLLPASYTCEAGQFVTGQLLRVDLLSGTAAIVNAGHPLPLRLRDGRVQEIDPDVEPPFGVEPGRSLQSQDFQLRPGDRIIFLTDGMQERNAAVLDVATALRDTADLHPREVVQELGAAVLHATRGDLREDATMVGLDW
jgi:hypothetical protein